MVVIVALLVIGGLIDRTSPSGTGPQAAAAVPPVPVAAPADAESSSWFCAGATGNAKGAAPGSLVIANTRTRPLTATVDLVGSASPAGSGGQQQGPAGSGGQQQGPAATSSVTVGPESRVAVPETLPGSPPWIAADVTLHGGAAAVEQEVTGPLGPSATPCATSGSRTWYFASGRTAINANDQISLFNPYPTESIVDLSFTTDQGLEAPGQFEALVVPASGLVSVNLGDHLRRRTRIATVVTARSGRVVAWQTQVVDPVPPGTPVIGPTGPPAGAIDPASPVPGVVVSLGSPKAATTWAWPDGVAGNGIDEQYAIYNPGPGTAQVQLALNLDQGSAQPFTLSIGPEEVSTVVSEGQARVPPGVTHSAIVRSTNGVAVVAERDASAGPPSTRLGLGVLVGERLASRSWLLAAGSASAKSDEWLILFNPGTRPVTASVARLAGGTAALPGLSSVAVAPGARAAVEINHADPTLDTALTVAATGPIYVERDLYGAPKEAGYSLSAGVPLLGG